VALKLRRVIDLEKYWDSENSFSRQSKTHIWAWRYETLPVHLQVSDPIVAVLVREPAVAQLDK